MNTYEVTGKPGATAIALGEPDTVESVLQAIKIILTTPKGTVPMYRDFGVNMDFLDMPIPGAEQRARMEIREAVEKWEPRATVRSITFSREGGQSGKLIPTVEVEINSE